MIYTIEIPDTSSFILQRILRRVLKQYWEESLFMAEDCENDDIYWSKNIDRTADIMIQVIEQDKEIY